MRGPWHVGKASGPETQRTPSRPTPLVYRGSTVYKFNDIILRQSTPAKHRASLRCAFLLRRLEIMPESEAAFARNARLFDHILEIRTGSH